ncbi:hypothetical protein [Flavobacterium collinsii]|uniref:Uncharacterized protein n=1 Tax=Flavobacterium collinsii TaxID=1114861 RepID=A0ABM8KDX1_9FLAO|nr:hypothetical protein [Flavobacterium collinsii]CAA9195062.1 hypothetical protein FLACOL7796_00420 [Flavobacterium collinsii]
MEKELPQWITDYAELQRHRQELEYMIEDVENDAKNKTAERVKWEQEMRDKTLEWKRKNITHNEKGQPIIYPTKYI